MDEPWRPDAAWNKLVTKGFHLRDARVVAFTEAESSGFQELGQGGNGELG